MDASCYFTNAQPLDETAASFPIFTGTACNLNCAFCEWRTRIGVPAAAAFERVIEDIQTASQQGVRSVVFKGGEPSINKFLPVFIGEARKLGISRTGIRTNALMLSYQDYLQRLMAKGLSFVKIVNVCHDSEWYDAVTCFQGAHDIMARGMSNAISAGLDVCAEIPLFGESFQRMPGTVKWLLIEFAGIEKIELRVDGFESSRYKPVPIQDLEHVLPEVLDACGERGVALSFAPFGGAPPCLFSNPEVLLTMFRYVCAPHFPRPSYHKKPGCGDCPLDALCNGMIQAYADAPWHGRVSERVAASVARRGIVKQNSIARDNAIWSEQAARDNALTISYRQTPDDDAEINECIVRTNYCCNEDCIFCFVDTYCPGPSDAMIREAITEVVRSGKKISIISISGGEPGLNQRLEEYIGMLRNAQSAELCIQTNATPFSDRRRAEAIARAGVHSAFVSLHSHDAIVSDLITGREGAFLKTLQGIRNLAAEGIFIYLSHVINSFNYASLPRFVDFVGNELEGAPIVFSFAAPHTRDMLFSGAIPKLSQARAPLKAALDACLQRKIPFSGLPGMCGVPLCLLGPEPRYYPDIHKVEQEALRGVMHKNSGCGQCALNNWCYGLRLFYAETFGDEELEPVTGMRFEPQIRNLDSRMQFFKTYFETGF